MLPPRARVPPSPAAPGPGSPLVANGGQGVRGHVVAVIRTGALAAEGILRQGQRTEPPPQPRDLQTLSTPKLTNGAGGAQGPNRSGPPPRGPWLPPAHREEALVLGRGWLQPPVLRLRVLHLLDACAQQLVLQQRRVGQAICGGGGALGASRGRGLGRVESAGRGIRGGQTSWAGPVAEWAGPSLTFAVV